MYECLEKIVRQPELHARWLNTFSYLEYIGFRKIVKSQSSRRLNFAVMSHASEEARHALILKRLALRIGGPRIDNYEAENLLNGEGAEIYFQSLDQTVARTLSHYGYVEDSQLARLSYLVVTWLIEIRAIEVYTDYGRALALIGQTSGLQHLLNEEDQHLAKVAQTLDEEFVSWQELKEIFIETERIHFEAYLRSLKALLA